MVLALLLALLPLVQERTTIKETHPDGSAKAEYEVVAGENAETVIDGAYRAWNPAGQLIAEGQYDRGYRTGEWKLFHEDGSLESEGSYLEDERHGPWKTYFASGAVRSEGKYERGFKSGRWSFWDEEGKKDKRNSGKYEIARDRLDDGGSTTSAEKSGKKHGRWIRRDANGAILEEGYFTTDKRSGEWVKYWPGTTTNT